MAIGDSNELDDLSVLAESLRQRQMRREMETPAASNPLRDVLVGVGSLGYGLGTGQSAPALAQNIIGSARQRDDNLRRQAALEEQQDLGILSKHLQQKAQLKAREKELPMRMHLELEKQLAYAAAMGRNQQELERLRLGGQEAIRRITGEQALGLQKLKGEQELEQIKAKPQAQAKARSAGGGESAVIPGYEMVSGASPTKDDVKKAKQSAIAFNRFEKALDALESAVKKYGVRSLPFSEGRAEIERAASQVVIEGKEAANLGALAGPDMNIILASIGSPTSAKAAVLGDQEYLNLLRNAKQSSVNQHDATIGVYGFKRAGQRAAPRSASSISPAQAREMLRQRGVLK